jgi:hypothetical protein
VLLVVLEQRLAERHELRDASVGDPVEDAPVLPATLDESAPSQAGEVVRDLGLADPEPLDEIADRPLAVAQQPQDAQARRVAQPTEVLGQQVGLGRLLGQRERRVAGAAMFWRGRDLPASSRAGRAQSSSPAASMSPSARP